MAEQPITRNFTGEEEAMLTRAQVFHDILEDEIAAFTLKFPDIDAGWLTNFQDDINNALEFPSDDVTRGNITQLTFDITGPSKTGLDQLAELDIYAKRRFADKPTLQKIFGRDTWDAARSDTEKLIKALESAHDWATDADINPTLVAVGSGYTALQVTALETRALEIRERNRLQEKAKNKRPMTTEDRIVLQNLVFGGMQNIHLCAQLVHKSSYANRTAYNLYLSGSGSTATTVILLIKRAGAPLADAEVEITSVALAPQTTAADGLTNFQSVNMGNSIDVKVTHATYGQLTETFTVVEGEENSFEMTY